MKIIKDGQEIDIKDLDKEFSNEVLENPLIMGGLIRLLLKHSMTFDKKEVLEEEIPVPHCTEDPTNCSLCNNGEELVVDFSGALDALKEGYRVTRKSWVEKGKQRYLYFVPAATYPSRTHVARQEFGEEVPYSAYIALITDLGYVTPYTITNPDLLAEDWLVISKDY